jgi:hypothetical protein
MLRLQRSIGRNEAVKLSTGKLNLTTRISLYKNNSLNFYRKQHKVVVCTIRLNSLYDRPTIILLTAFKELFIDL